MFLLLKDICYAELTVRCVIFRKRHRRFQRRQAVSPKTQRAGSRTRDSRILLALHGNDFEGLQIVLVAYNEGSNCWVDRPKQSFQHSGFLEEPRQSPCKIL